MVYQYVLVAAMAASPIGEELVAIPLGIGFDLPPIAVGIVALVFNFLPAVLISALFARAERSGGSLKWLTRLRRERVARLLDRFGIPAIVAGAPWLGVYGTVATLEMMGMRRRRILGAVFASLVIYAVIFTAASAAIF
jgi:hypothetical protein